MDGHFVTNGCYVKYVPLQKNRNRRAPDLPSLLLCVWRSKSFVITPQGIISIHLITQWPKDLDFQNNSTGQKKKQCVLLHFFNQS